MKIMRTLLFFFLCASLWAAAHPALAGELELRVTDSESGDPLSVRMHVFSARDRIQQPRGSLWYHDHFVFHYRTILDLPVGEYKFVMERGPEYHTRRGHFSISRGAADTKYVTMTRYVNMAEAGWYSGDLQIHRPLDNIELLMKAEDLHIGPVITWSNNQNQWAGRTLPEERSIRFDDNRIYNVLAGRDARPGGALLYFNLPEPLPLADSGPALSLPADLSNQAEHASSTHIAIENPFSKDLPIWLASGRCHSVAVLNDHSHYNGAVADREIAGKPRDPQLYPSPQGIGRWSEALYYQILNCGIEIAPSAGSGSGLQPNPAGYNRVYVHCENGLDYESWWAGLRRGQVVVTNGPLIQPRANGELPGHHFTAAEGESIDLEIALNLATRDTIEYLEIIKNGEVESRVRLNDWAANNGRLPIVHFEESGWFLVRAVTNVRETYRLAMTGPYYVSVGKEPRISREAAQFFLDWVIEQANDLEIADPAQRESIMRDYQAAQAYWEDLVDRANAE